MADIKIWIIHHLVKDFLISLLIFLMYERKPDIILELGNCEINLDPILKIWIIIDPLEQSLGKCANNTLLIVVDDILEELIDEFNLKVS